MIGKKKIKRKYTPTQSANHRIISLDIPISKITHSGNKKKWKKKKGSKRLYSVTLHNNL